MTKVAKAFCNRIWSSGYSTIIYGNSADLSLYNLGDLAKYGFWYAEYGSHPTMDLNFVLWQYTDEGTVDGIEGNVDIDINGFTCDYLDPSAHLVVFTTGSNCYENRWDDPVFDEMVASSMQELDQAKREQLIIEAETYLADQMPACPILSFNDDYLVKPNITGIIKNYIGHICFEYAEVN